MDKKCTRKYIFNTTPSIIVTVNKIIIEGPDCSGKSTLVDRIKNVLRWDAKSLHHVEGDQFNRYLSEYVSANNTVLDRSHFSEIVYSDLWGRSRPFTKEEGRLLDFASQRNSVIIFACPTLEIMESRYKKRKFDQQIKFEELEKSRNLFIDTLNGIKKLAYFSRDFEELDNLVFKVKEMIK